MKGNSGLRCFVILLPAMLLAAACAKQPDYGQGAAGASDVAPGPGYSQGAPTGPGGIGEQDVREQDRTAPRQGFQGMGVEVRNLERVHFDYDRYTLSDEARRILARNGAFILARPDLKIIVEGHCDERGSDEYNLALGEKRARAVQGYLASLGVPASRLRVISYGEEIPLDRSGTEAAWAKNRRVEFKEDR